MQRSRRSPSLSSVLGFFCLALGGPSCGGERGEADELGVERARDIAAPIATVMPTAIACPGPPILALIRHCGDVTITNQAEADAYAGIQSIVGNLTIKAGRKKVGSSSGENIYQPGFSFSMPDLKVVTGKLEIDLDRVTTARFGDLERVGGDLAVTMHLFLVDATPWPTRSTSELKMPDLTQVGGSIRLTGAENANLNDAVHTFDFGLNHVTDLGGSVEASADQNGKLEALNGLTTVPGSVAISWPGPIDFFAPELLSSVTDVAGDFSVNGTSNLQDFMPVLKTIGHTLTIRPVLLNSRTELRYGSAFPALETIGGDMVWQQASAQSCSPKELAKLKQVDGTIHIIDTNVKARFGKSGTTGLLAGGLEITGSKGFMPFFPNLRLTSSATVSVHDNPDLCQCFVSTLQTNLTTQGWPGTIDQANNGTCNTCQSCP